MADTTVADTTYDSKPGLLGIPHGEWSALIIGTLLGFIGGYAACKLWAHMKTKS